MPKIPPRWVGLRQQLIRQIVVEVWDNFPPGVRRHLIDRMRGRAIGVADLNYLRVWIDSNPEVPDDDRYKDFGSFKTCGKGALPKTFLLRGQSAKGTAV
jgi:hypothetical protein